ncbi:hypothetical protein ACSSS7_002387 [Eimeria intestinalis]
MQHHAEAAATYSCQLATAAAKTISMQLSICNSSSKTIGMQPQAASPATATAAAIREKRKSVPRVYKLLFFVSSTFKAETTAAAAEAAAAKLVSFALLPGRMQEEQQHVCVANAVGSWKLSTRKRTGSPSATVAAAAATAAEAAT